MKLELIISQPQPAITGNPECDNIEQVEITCYSQLLEIVDNQCNVPWIQANIQFLNTIKGVGISNIEKTSTIGLVDTYTITYTDGTTSTFNVINGKDGIGTDGRGIVSIIKTSTVGLVDTYTITYSDSTTSTFDVTNGTSAYQIYLAGGGTLSEVDYNASITNIPTHIEDTDIHHTSESLANTFEPKRGDDDNYVTDAEKIVLGNTSGENTGDQDLSGLLKLDQTTPQTLIGSPIFSGLTATVVPYIDANRQLKYTVVKYDSVKQQLQIGTSTGNSSGYGLATNKNIITDGFISVGGGTASLRYNEFWTNQETYTIKNTNTGVNSSFEIWTKNVLAATFTPTQGLKVVSGIQCGDDTAAASADKVGTTRYRATANASYVEMCMQVGASSYSWVAIVINTW